MRRNEMDVRMVAGTLRRCPLFERLENNDLGKLAQIVEAHVFDPRDLVFRPGEVGGSLFILALGHIEFFTLIDGRERALAMLGPVASFGELSLLLPGPRMIGARAKEEATVYELTHGLLKMLETSDPELALKLIDALRSTAAKTFAPMRSLLEQLFIGAVREATPT